MNNKLYVGNLSWNVTEDQLKEAFGQAGTVTSTAIIMDKMTGKSKGFGFVEMSSDEEAQAAITMWNDKELDGRPLRVNIARPKEER
jgi:RNA recognition motif-containing protein